jgi:hypothetical protein
VQASDDPEVLDQFLPLSRRASRAPSTADSGPDPDRTSRGHRDQDAAQLGVAVKDPRDLIHRRSELRQKITIDRLSAAGMAHLLQVMVCDLGAASRDGRVVAYAAK